MYKKNSGSIVIFLILYVDDILLTGNDIPTLLNVKQWLGKCFSMKDLGKAETILGIRIYRERSKRLLGLSQEKCWVSHAINHINIKRKTRETYKDRIVYSIIN